MESGNEDDFLENLLNEVLRQAEFQQEVLVAVATGKVEIEGVERDYQEIYLEFGLNIEMLQELNVEISNPNPYPSLWNWHGSYSNDLPTYASRREHISKLFENLVNPIKMALRRHRTKPSATSLDLLRDLQQRMNQPTSESVTDYQISFASFHPKVAHRCSDLFEAGRYDDAILNSLIVVEEEIRERVSGDPTDIGVNLVSTAMASGTPKLVFSDVPAEQDAAHLLFRAAIGMFKNPRSHRFLDTDDPVKTFEILAFASLLMRMLDEAKRSSET